VGESFPRLPLPSSEVSQLASANRVGNGTLTGVDTSFALASGVPLRSPFGFDPEWSGQAVSAFDPAIEYDWTGSVYTPTRSKSIAVPFNA